MLKNTKYKLRMAARFEALDFIRLRHGDDPYADLMLGQLPHAHPLFTDVQAALVNYDFRSAIKKLDVISKYGYSIDDREIAQHAADVAQNLYEDALDELGEESLYAYFALYEGLLDSYSLIVYD